MEKNLPEECCGYFSTQPYHNRILIGDLVEHSPEPFPCAAVIYLNAEMYTNPCTSTYVSLFISACLSSIVVSRKGPMGSAPCPWAQTRGWVDIRAINIVYCQVLKVVQILYFLEISLHLDFISRPCLMW